MSVGRRQFVLAVCFLSAVSVLCPDQRIHAQPPKVGQHDIWDKQLTPDQIRNQLERLLNNDGGQNKSFEKFISDLVKNKNPDAPPEQVDAAIKKLLSDKDFMNKLTDIAQKQKNQNAKEFPQLTPSDIEKLKNMMPKGENPFQLPKFDPNQLPKIDPNTGLPVDPKAPPKFEQPKVDPPKTLPKFEPPKLNPNEPPPPPPQPPKFDRENPLGTPKQTAEQIAKAKAAETVTALWEKNVGPIEESPAVQRAILDLVNDPEAMDAFTDEKGNSFFDMFRDAGTDDSLKDLFGDTGGKWEWPKLDLGLDLNWGRNNLDVGNSRPRLPESSSRWPSSNRSFDGLGSFNFGGMQVPWLLMLILLALVIAFVVWWKWDLFVQPRNRLALAGTAGGLGAWPIDPRNINTREDIVKAFEYLSVLICGPNARTWTHSTIAEELSLLAATHGETAVKLARLYELARYAPLDEPLTRAEVFEARRLVCDLAGVDEA